jgi:exonuclease III
MQNLNARKIARNTRAELNVTAININGRGGRSIQERGHKWHDLHRIMHDDKIGVLVVGETHLSDAQVEEIQNSHLGNRMKVHNSIDPLHPNSMGIAVVLNHDLTNTSDTKVTQLIPGRAILVTIPWHSSEKITILAIYAPADSAAANRQFWEELHKIWMTRNLAVPDMMLGDTNIVEDAIDRLPHKRDDDEATNALAKFKRLLELKDGWRVTYPDTRAYTYTHTSGDSFSRLDRIYVSPALLSVCRNWTISDLGTLTDHRMVPSPSGSQGHLLLEKADMR